MTASMAMTIRRRVSPARHGTTVGYPSSINHEGNVAWPSTTTSCTCGQLQATKDSILLQAAKAVFSPQTSGYLRKESEPQAGGPVLEIIRNFTGKA
jgi:hypothetical protein